jgi:hypothetical protein
MRPRFFIAPPADIPVPESFNSGKRMIPGAQNTACPDFLKIKRFIRFILVCQVFGQNNMRHIDAAVFHIVQPF